MNTAAGPETDRVAAWRKLVTAELAGAPFEKKLVTRTAEGIALQPIYGRADIAGLPLHAAVPGAPPFTRGVRPAGYRTAPWECAQEIAAATPGGFNRAILADLRQGQNSVVLTAAGAARPGVALAGADDVATALADVDLTAVPIHLRGGDDPLPLAASLLALARNRGVAWPLLRGSITADPLGCGAARGTLPADLQPAFEALAGWTRWAAAHAPRLQTIEVDAAQWANAGGTAVQELAGAIAAGAEYLRRLARHGAAPELAAPRMRFRLASGPQFFMEVAKFRALRPLWARVCAAFGSPAEVAARATVHAATATWNQTRLDPHVNLLRATTEALAAILGGCDSVHVAPFDEVTGATSDFSRRIARNVHALLAEEFGLAQIADPAGGSWYVEKLTDDLARRAWAQFQEIERHGGFEAALRSGHLQELVAQSAAEKTGAAAQRRLALVGTNLYPNLKDKLPAAPAAELDPAVAPADDGATAPAATGGWPARIEAAIAAAGSGAPLARLASPGVAGTGHASFPPLRPWRAAAPFEALRAASAALGQRTGKPPRVFLAKLGPPAQHKARSDFATGFFAAGGFAVEGRESFTTPESAAHAFVASGASIAVLCSTDETHPTLVPAFAREVKTVRPQAIVVLAGLPADPAVAASFRVDGVDEFIHLRAPLPDLLNTLLARIEATTCS